ncbi:MAG: hypothetical protein FWE78_04575 [Methanimicrococcus sp.]|nr:hypothetical protein [Methanimicrococcus sp.]
MTVTDISDLQAAVNAAAPDDEIVLDLDVASLPATLPGTVTINKNLKIRSVDPTDPAVIYIDANARHFNVTGGTVTLSDLILDGGANAGGITVSGSSTVLDTYNVTIQNCKFTSNSSVSGGGVLVQGGSLYTMHSGAIQNNIASGAGGGVYVTGSGSDFTLRGGLISDNLATNGGLAVSLNGMGGGVGIASNGHFIMYGGAISGNEAGNGSAGGGVGLDNASFLMDGGVIGGAGVGNKAASGGGVGVGNNSNFIMDNGSVTGNFITGNGGGVSVNPMGGTTASSFILNNGTISENEADRGGGGVFVGTTSTRVHTFTMNGGAIRGNIGGDLNHGGGGVFINGCSFTMNGGVIEDNVVLYPPIGGGGIYLRTGPSTPGTFTMTAGKIHNNTATGNGGGIYNNNTASATAVNITGGEISNNTAAGNGGGIYNNNTASATAINITGSVISNNTATDGGGIWPGSTNANRTRVKVGANVAFFGNSAGTAYIISDGDRAGYNSAVNALTTISLPSPLFNAWNNYDIGYKDGVPMAVYKVTYRANWPSGEGAESGSAPADINYYLAETPVTVLVNSGDLAKEGYAFLGWAADGTAFTPDYAVSGSEVTPEIFEIFGNTELYAVWFADPTQRPEVKIGQIEGQEGSDASNTHKTGQANIGAGPQDSLGSGGLQGPKDADGTDEAPVWITPVNLLSLLLLIGGAVSVGLLIPLLVFRRWERDEEEGR